MGLAKLGRRPEERVGFLGATELVGLQRQGRLGKAGTTATLDEALRNAATWACIDVLSDAIARTPFDVVRKVGKARLPIEPTPSVIADPSGIVQPDVWMSQMAFSVVTDGNAFGQIVGLDARGWPTQIETLDPDCVTNRRVIDGVATVKVDRKDHVLWPLGDILHIPGRVVPPGSPWGLSPLAAAGKAIGTSLAAEDFSNKFFTEGGHPSGILKADQSLTPEQAEAIKAAFRRATENSREPAVMGSGLSYESIQIDPKDSQFLDLMAFEVLQVCRFWRVPPSMVYGAVSGQNVTYSNITDADLQYLKHSLDGYLVRFEGALSRCLMPDLKVKANRDAILRMDAVKRNEVYDKRLRNRTLAINDVKALEDEAPLTGAIYDTPGYPPEIIDAVGALVRAGFDPEASLAALGLPPIAHTGLVPITVQGDNVATAV